MGGLTTPLPLVKQKLVIIYHCSPVNYMKCTFKVNQNKSCVAFPQRFKYFWGATFFLVMILFGQVFLAKHKKKSTFLGSKPVSESLCHGGFEYIHELWFKLVQFV